MKKVQLKKYDIKSNFSAVQTCSEVILSQQFSKQLDGYASYLREVTWNVPKIMWRIYFACYTVCIFFWNAPKSYILIFGSFLDLKLITCFSRTAPFFYIQSFWNAPLPIWFWKSRIKHVINFKTRKEPKINISDFGAFQEKYA